MGSEKGKLRVPSDGESEAHNLLWEMQQVKMVSIRLERSWCLDAQAEEVLRAQLCSSFFFF